MKAIALFLALALPISAAERWYRFGIIGRAGQNGVSSLPNAVQSLTVGESELLSVHTRIGGGGFTKTPLLLFTMAGTDVTFAVNPGDNIVGPGELTVSLVGHDPQASTAAAMWTVQVRSLAGVVSPQSDTVVTVERSETMDHWVPVLSLPEPSTNAFWRLRAEK